jgi:hypothetical protein
VIQHLRDWWTRNGEAVRDAMTRLGVVVPGRHYCVICMTPSWSWTPWRNLTCGHPLCERRDAYERLGLCFGGKLEVVVVGEDGDWEARCPECREIITQLDSRMLVPDHPRKPFVEPLPGVTYQVDDTGRVYVEYIQPTCTWGDCKRPAMTPFARLCDHHGQPAPFTSYDTGPADREPDVDEQRMPCGCIVPLRKPSTYDHRVTCSTYEAGLEGDRDGQ